MDATGLSVTRYEGRWSTTPHGERRHQKYWLKLNAIIENDTKAFIGWTFTDPWVHDTTQFVDVLADANVFFETVHADAGYLSYRNCEFVERRGGTPYIRPKKTSNGHTKKVRGLSNRRRRSAYHTMLTEHEADPAAWLATYAVRNRIESTFAGVKVRFGGRLGAVGRRMLVIEATLKLLVWNLTRIEL